MKLRLGLVLATVAVAAASPALAQQPEFGDAFWKRWGDGQAEVAGYALTIRRYGQERKGTAVAITVTETFSNAARVKSDRLPAGSPDAVPVLKLNLVKDFSTGVYDYNLMTSTFVALRAVNGLPAGAATKVSFTAQEWCGHAYQHLLFGADGVSDELHSYFEGEADRTRRLVGQPKGLSEDALFLWARGLAFPLVAPGEERTVPLLRSAQFARLQHRPVRWTQVTLKRGATPSSLTVPAGTFEVEVLEAKVPSGPTWTFHVERAEPRKLIKWSSSEGESGELLGADRMAYWKLNGEGGEKALERIGLKARPPRTP